ncbi:MAG: BatA domain-containing protein, partial [Lentisphaeraceae bacterium]|nr:BatA domain-containing protein [Lentisphaeraceae bacterium]
MTFLNSALLWGLGLVSVPIIIHLIRKNKVIEVEWAAMDFLLDIVEEQSKKLQMEDLLLLLLRVGVILFLVLALARPVLQSIGGSAGGNTVLALDDTYSMATVSGTKNRFKRASEAAAAILGKMSGEGGSALVLHRANAKKVISSFSSDEDLMNETVSQLKVSDYHSNGPDGLKACLEILEREKPVSATVYFISDFQRSEWEEPSSEVIDIVKKLREKAEVVFVNAGDSEVDNLSVEEIRSLQDAVKINQTAWFAAKIRNYGQEDVADVQVQFLLNDEVKESISVSVPANQTNSLVFNTQILDAGFHSASIKISADKNQRDNAGHVHFKVHDKLKVLVVQNHLPDQLEDKRSLYWDFALNPFPGASQSEKALFKFSWAATDALTTEDLNDFAFVILDDVQAITNTETVFIEEYVANGGGLLINLGPSVDIDNYNNNLHKNGNGILAWPLMDKAIEEKVK